MNTLQSRIAEVMNSTSWTVKQMAEIANVSSSAVTQWKDGPTKSLKIEPASKLAARSGFSAVWIATGSGPKRDLSPHDNVGRAPFQGSVPLISTVRAGSWGEIDDHEPDTDKRVDARFSKPSQYAFALEIEGDSMRNDHGDPSFPEGTVVIVEPERQAKAGDYVVAKDTSTQRATFKRLMTDGARWYLRPLNRDYPTLEIDEPEKRVIGVVIEYWVGGKL